MPLMRPLLRQLPQRTLLISRSPSSSTLSTTTTSAPSKSFATTSFRRADDAHESRYDPPGGWLWGRPPGEKYEKEGWEGIWYWGVWGSLGLTVVAYAYKPDTSIQTWALEEAQRRLQIEGILPDTHPGQGPQVPK